MAQGTNMRDGLGGEELGQPGSQVSNVWLTGSVVTTSNIFAAGSVVASGATFSDVLSTTSNLSATGSVVSAGVHSSADITTTNSVKFITGSPFKEGIVINNLTAIATISGGMWVAGSKDYAVPAWASCPNPLGYCVATTGSPSNPEILVNGIAPFIAEGTITAGTPVRVGAGTALNCVVAFAGSPAQINEVGYKAGTAIGNAGSEGTIFVYIH